MTASGNPTPSSPHLLQPPDRETAKHLRDFLAEAGCHPAALRGDCGRNGQAAFRFRSVQYSYMANRKAIELLGAREYLEVARKLFDRGLLARV